MSSMDPTQQTPPVVRLTQALDNATVLDRAVRAVEPTVQSVFGTEPRASVLRGEWLGHAVHPVLTDFTLGTWTSAVVLDLVGGAESAPAAQLLLGAGLLAAAPTAWTGWAEWTAAGPQEQRTGLVHAVTSGTAIAMYAASWLARRRSDHAAGVRLALAGTAVAGLGAYLGGHLAIARKVGTRDPAYVR